ncbi:PREDICTED: blue copper protein [Fragaria vesca subsp. vesca]|uniref:blue copper protein n=1 Tax=Fragaria vesca subsp. vesca TaxID=101020 RepID=UPI0002C35F0F|nr:PREDICTED: blue copper protein [Fragaria vesca subsp. vesca]
MAVPTRTILMSFVMMNVLVELAAAATYTVGGPNGGWDASTDLQTWASSQTFLVGDNLNFQYSPSHNVLEVSKADYDSCQGSNSIQAYSGGSTTIPLSSAGKRYFICGTIGHCSQGMKLEVGTSPATTSAPPPTASPAVNLAPQGSPSATLPPSSDTPLASSLAPDTSAASPSPAHSPELAFSPTPTAVTIPATESPTSISRTGASSEPSAASSLNKGGLTLGFGIMMILFLAF